MLGTDNALCEKEVNDEQDDGPSVEKDTGCYADVEVVRVSGPAHAQAEGRQTNVAESKGGAIEDEEYSAFLIAKEEEEVRGAEENEDDQKDC